MVKQYVMYLIKARVEGYVRLMVSSIHLLILTDGENMNNTLPSQKFKFTKETIREKDCFGKNANCLRMIWI
jgi:hypothetical protein